jgi:hypothetical protein
MADEKNSNNNQNTRAAAAGASADMPSQRQPDDLKEQRGGEQSDQISGETQKGAHNQEMKNRNPQGNKPNQNTSARQKGDTF